MDRCEHDAPTAVDSQSRYRRNACHGRQPIYIQYHHAIPSPRLKNRSARRSSTASSFLSTTPRPHTRSILTFKPVGDVGTVSLEDILRDMSHVHQRLALAEHIFNSTAHTPFSSEYTYRPLDLPTAPKSVIETKFHLQPHQLKLFAIVAQLSEPVLPFLYHPATLQRVVHTHHTSLTPLYTMVHALEHPPATSLSPPTHILCFFAAVLNGVSGWTHVSALASEHYYTTRHPWSQWNTQLQAHKHVIHSEQDTPHDLLPDHVTSRWSFTTAPRSPPLAAPVAEAKFQNTRWFLYASGATINTLDDTQRLRLRTFIKTHHKSHSDMAAPPITLFHL